MELSDLKSIWQKTSGAQGDGYFVSSEHMQALIKKKSKTTVSEIKRSVRNKALMAGSISTASILFSLIALTSDKDVFFASDILNNTDIGILYLTIGSIILFISMYNAISYRRIIRIEKHESSLKVAITDILAVLRSAIKVKVYSDTFGTPSAFIGMFVWGIIRQGSLFSDAPVLIGLLVGGAAFSAFSHFTSKRTQRKRYGRQIDALEECLGELEENE